MSYWDDHEFDPYADEADYEEYSVKCKYCGRGEFEWVETHKGWRLFDADGDMHNCHQRDSAAEAFAKKIKSPLDKH